MINPKKTTQEILQEEMLRERAATLTRAAERLTEALERLHEMEGEIAAGMALCRAGETAETDARYVGEVPTGTGAEESDGGRRFLQELNGKIQAYNRQRENARTRYYYLIVTREALGIIHHQRLEEFYRIPPKRHCLPEGWDFQRRG
jgi:hypothetical protein